MMASVACRILWFEPLWIAALAPSVLFPGRFWDRDLHALLVVLLFAFWPLRLYVRPLNLFRSPIGFAAVAMAAWLPVTIAVSAEPSRSWEWAGFIALGIAAFAALIEWPPVMLRPARIAWALIAIGAALALIGPLLVGAIPDKLELLVSTRPRAALAAGLLGETVNPNVLAGALVMVLPLATALAYSAGPSLWQKWISSAACLLMLAALLWTQSRGAYVAAGASHTLLAALLLPSRRWWPSVALAATFAVIIFARGSAGIAAALAASDGGLARRAQIWQRAVLAIRDAPLAGIGFSQFDVVIPGQYPYGPAIAAPPAHAHNLLLQIGVDAGLVGLLIMAILWTSAFYALFTLLHTKPRQNLAPQFSLARTMAAGASAGLCAMLVHGLVDAVLWSSKMAFMPWILYAITVCLSTTVRRSGRLRGTAAPTPNCRAKHRDNSMPLVLENPPESRNA